MKRLFLIPLFAASAFAGPFDDWLATQADQDLPRAKARWKDHITVRATNVCPEGFTVTGYTYEQVAEDRIVETAVCAPVVAWTNTAEYAARVKAATIVGAIQQTLQSIGVAPENDAQVSAAVDAWVQSEGTVEALATATRLFRWDVKLKQIVGDSTGLVKGDRVISLEENTPMIVEAP